MRLLVGLAVAVAVCGQRSPAALRPYHLTGSETVRRRTRQEALGSPHHHHHVPLLVLIFSVNGNSARRDAQYRTWLAHPWRSARGDPVPWRYVYVLGRSGGGGAVSQADQPGELLGDTVTLGRVEDTYLNLVHKTLEALRWAVTSVSFDVLVKTDDDSLLPGLRATPDSDQTPPF